MRSNFWIFTYTPGPFFSIFLDICSALGRDVCRAYNVHLHTCNLAWWGIQYIEEISPSDCHDIYTPISHANHNPYIDFFWGEICTSLLSAQMQFWQMPLLDHAMHCNEVFNGVYQYSGQHTFYVQPSNSIHLQVYKKDGNKSLLTCCLVHTRNMNMMSLTVA